MLFSAAVFLQLSCWSEKYTGIESNDRYAKNMKLQSKNVALGAKQGRPLQITILKKISEVFGKIIIGSLSYLIYIHNSHIFTIVYEDALKQEASKHASNSF